MKFSHCVSDQEWHLHNCGQAKGVVDADCNILPAWAHTRGDAKITIAIIDNGFDLSHPGICKPDKFRDPYDASREQFDPPPKSFIAAHGTACAELAVGTGDNNTIQGTAPGCTWMPIRISGKVGDPQEVSAFKHAFDHGADVIACSWGALDKARNDHWPIPPALKKMIRRCIQQGRDGRGIPILFAAGNGNEAVELDGYACNPDIICVSATTNQNAKAPYSDYGKNVWVAAPSSGGTLTISSTVRGSRAGPKTTLNEFGSTSASVALAAGVVGLILSANAALNVSEVRAILKNSAVKINRNQTPVSFVDHWGRHYNDGYDEHGHSRTYGWGRINAGAAVEDALRLQTQLKGL